MRRLRLLRHRLRSLFRRRAVEDELERELSLHLEQLTRERLESGLSPAEARRAARHAFGSAGLAKEQCRDARRVGWLEDLAKDVGYASRLLARSPAFTLTAVISLALGIGANTAIFSLVDTVLLRLLPVEKPRELVFLNSVGTEGPSGAPPYPCFERFRNETSSFAGMAAFAADETKVEVDGQVEQVFGQVASGSYFDVLGLRPAVGRLMHEDDERLDPPVAVIGYGYWQRRFGGNPNVIGKTLTVGDRIHTIVGVTPPEFWGLQPGRQVDVTLPIAVARGMLANAGAWWLHGVVARLQPEATVERASAEVDTIFQSFMKDQDQSGEIRKKYFDHMELASAAQGLDNLRSRFTAPLYALMLVTGIVLLIACANLGSLLLARGAARRREFAIRRATGAAAGRLLRQLLTETLLLFLLGAAAGLLVAYVAIQGLTGFFAIGRQPIVLEVQYDWKLGGFAAGVALIAGLLTGLWPALRALRTDPQAALKDGEARLTGSRELAAAGRLLVAVQVALSLVLLVAAAMFLRTMVNLRNVDLGFTGGRVLTMSLQADFPGEEAVEREQFWKHVLERVRELPGVRAASLSVLTPLSGRDVGKLITVPGFRARTQTDRVTHLNHVSEDYFRTFGIQIVAGRALTARDARRALKVAVVNEAAARTYFAGRSPIGETIRFSESEAYQVVGVVRDHKHMSVRAQAPRFAFIPLWQPLEDISRITVAVASAQPPAGVARAVAHEVRAIHPTTLVSDVIGVDEQIDATLVSERLLSTLAAAFAALALGLAAIGLYGVLSYSVARRKAELGIRMALGAAPAHVAWSVLRDVLLQVAAGMALGLPIALAGARAAEGLLFGVASADPSNYLLSTAVLAAVACVAGWLPARRACSIDPAEALRRD